MPLWDAHQYGNVVGQFRQWAGTDLWDEMLVSFTMLLERGNLCGRPVTAPLGDGIFELRANHDNRHGRLLFYFSPSERRLIVVVHGLVKKTKRVPQADIDLAKRRRAEIERGAPIHVISSLGSHRTH